MVDQKTQNVLPDGGWGYVIIFATASAMFILIPATQNFGFIFRPVFQDMELSGQAIGTIVNINSGAGFIFGIFHGPLMKIFGYRAYSMIGAALTSTGHFMMSFSYSVFGFIVYFGIIHSIGQCITHTAFMFALTSYFVKKRTFAVGIAYTVAGIGSVVAPLILSKAIAYYGARATAMITSAMLLNNFVFAMLLQPVEWHYKRSNFKNEETALKNRTETVKEEIDGSRKKDSVNVAEDGTAVETTPLKSEEETGEIPPRRDEKIEKSGCWQFLVNWFDLNLLKDPIFVSILFGMSFAVSGETTFTMLYPIILGDMGFSVEEIATVISVTAAVDIAFRCVVPVIDKLFKWPTRGMYMLTLLLLITSRYCLTLVSSFRNTLIVAAYIGVAKGFQTVYRAVVLANYIPIEKLPSAQGLETVLNGLMLLSIGPLVGKLRDYFGDFNVVIYLTNTLSIITLCIWSFEKIIFDASRRMETR